MKKIQQLEKAVVHHQKPLKKHRSKENQIVPILVNPLSPRRRRGKRKVSFDASVVDNEPSVSEPEEPDNSRLEDEPMPSNLDCM